MEAGRMSFESQIEAAFIALLGNATYIKTNSIPVRAAEVNSEPGAALVVVQADDLESMNFTDGVNWKMTLTVSSWVYRPDDGTRSTLDGLHDAVFKALKAADMSAINATLTGLEILGMVWQPVASGEDQDGRYHARQIKIEIHVEEVPATT